MPNLVRLTVELVPPRFRRWWRQVHDGNARPARALRAIRETVGIFGHPPIEGRSVLVAEPVARHFMDLAGMIPGWDEDEDPKPILWEDGADVPENGVEDDEDD